MSARSRLLLLACLSASCIILGGCMASDPNAPGPISPDPTYELMSIKPPPPYISVTGVVSSEAGGPVLKIKITARGDYQFMDKSSGGSASAVYIQLHMEDEAEDGKGVTVEKVHTLNTADLTSLNDKELSEHRIDLTATVGDLSKVIYAEYTCKFWVESGWEPDGWVSCSVEK